MACPDIKECWEFGLKNGKARQFSLSATGAIDFLRGLLDSLMTLLGTTTPAAADTDNQIFAWCLKPDLVSQARFNELWF